VAEGAPLTEVRFVEHWRTSGRGFYGLGFAIAHFATDDGRAECGTPLRGECHYVDKVDRIPLCRRCLALERAGTYKRRHDRRS